MGLLSYFAFSIIAGIAHGMDKYSPGALSSVAAKIISGSQALSEAYPAIGISIVLSIVMVVVAAFVLEHQEI